MHKLTHHPLMGTVAVSRLMFGAFSLFLRYARWSFPVLTLIFQRRTFLVPWRTQGALPLGTSLNLPGKPLATLQMNLK